MSSKWKNVLLLLNLKYLHKVLLNYPMVIKHYKIKTLLITNKLKKNVCNIKFESFKIAQK